MPFTGPDAALNILKFIGLKATADSAGLVGFEDILTLTSRMITVELNGGTVLVPLAPAATIDWGLSFPDTSGLEVQTGDPENPVVLDYRGTPLVGVSAEHVVLDIGEFVHLSGAFSFRMGEVETVDVNTGVLDPLVPPPSLVGLTNVTDTDDGTLGRTTDYSTIWNLRVSTIKVGAEGVSLFIGHNLAPFDIDTDDNGVLDLDELGDDAQGFFVEDLDVGLVLASVVPFTGPNAALNVLKFLSFKATADSAGLVGFEDIVTLTARMVEVGANQGTVLVPLAPAATIDWGLSFPDTSGLEVQTGDPENPVVLDYRGTPLIAVSAEHVLLDIGEFVHVSGAFSFRIGEVETVDVNTGIVSDVPVPSLIGLTNVTDTDDGTLGRTTDFSMIWNLRVNTIKIGAEGVSVFIGTGLADYDIDDDIENDDGTLNMDELGAGAQGFFVENVDLGLVLATAVPFTGPNAALNVLKFIGLKVTADSAGLVGFEDVLELTIRTVTVEVNMGTVLVPSAPAAVIDWQLSYPDTGGYEAPTGDPLNPVLIDFRGTPVIAVSAQRVLLQISDFIHISGAFSFRFGEVEIVDVATGLSATAGATVPALNTITTLDDTDAGPASGLARKTDYSMIWNLRVNTIKIGAEDVSIFVGLATGLGSTWNLETDDDGMLDLAELEALDATGFFIGNLDFGLVMMSAVPFLPTSPQFSPQRRSAEAPRAQGVRGRHRLDRDRRDGRHGNRRQGRGQPGDVLADRHGAQAGGELDLVLPGRRRLRRAHR